MKSKSLGGKSELTNKKSKSSTKKKMQSSNSKKQSNEKRENTKLTDPATQTTKKSNEEYAIESIEGFMNFNSKPYYLVHWKGYDRADDMTWEPEKDIDSCDILINKFWTKRFAINNYKTLTKNKSNSSQNSKNDNSDGTKNSDVESKNDSSDNESIGEHGFDIIKSQYQEIIRLKKERKEHLKQINYFKQLQDMNKTKSNENTKANTMNDKNLNDNIDISNTDDSDISFQSDGDSGSDINEYENLAVNKNDNYDTEIKSKLESGYIPDYIFKSRCMNSKQQYLVKWSGFEENDSSWVNEDMIDEQYVKIFRLVYCSPMIKQLRIVFMNEKKLIHQYNVLFSNGQLLWLSEGQIKNKLLHEFKAKKKFNSYLS